MFLHETTDDSKLINPRLERKRRDRSYLRVQIRELETLARRSWLSSADTERLQYYRRKLEKLKR